MPPPDVRDAKHRAYPPPTTAYIMHQAWHDLLFAHWPISSEIMRTLVPDCLHLDLFDGMAWIGVVPFHMSGVRPRWTPSVPGLSAFPELNVRTYVITNGRPGVYFFSLDAANKLAVAAARKFYHLPYFHADMIVQLHGEQIDYASVRRQAGATPANLRCTYSPIGPVRLAVPGTLDHWLTERYCLYTTDPEGRLLRCEIHHPQWPLQPATATFHENSMAEAAGMRLPDDAPILHFSKRLEVLIWPIQRCDC